MKPVIRASRFFGFANLANNPRSKTLSSARDPSRTRRLLLGLRYGLDFARNHKRILHVMGRSKTSAGLIMFRRKKGGLEVFLVHPGGPYFRNKDDGAWTIPKGEVAEGEELRARARIEFEEELGIAPAEKGWIDLGSVKQKGGKTVHAWAFAGDLEPNFKLASNTFELEWPPRSGKVQQFPEIDRAEFFPIGEAKIRINEAQTTFLDRLVQVLDSGGSRIIDPRDRPFSQPRLDR